jgi:Mrp family chromosome partitioning ATPase
MNELLQELKQRFDYIVISSGAYTINANAQAISQYADTSVFVIRHGVTAKSALVMLSNEGKIARMKDAHLLFNDVRKRGWLKGSYGFGYGYGYELKQRV